MYNPWDAGVQPFCYSNWQELVGELVGKTEEIEKQIDELKKVVAHLEETTEEKNGEHNLEVTSKKRSRREKKIFKKNVLCSFEGCSKRYSSNIALNAHIRRCHRHPTSSSSEYQYPL